MSKNVVRFFLTYQNIPFIIRIEFLNSILIFIYLDRYISKLNINLQFFQIIFYLKKSKRLKYKIKIINSKLNIKQKRKEFKYNI